MARPYAIVTAAGASTRMGAPKALLPWGLSTLIQYQLAQLRAARVEGQIVVVGAEPMATAERAAKAGAAVVANADWAEGRASSIRAAAAAVPDDADPIIVLGVDQPRPAAVMRALLDAYAARPAPIVVPVHDGRRGHPVVFAGPLLSELRAVRDEEMGLRSLMERYADDVREVDAGTSLIHIDVNTPEDYEAAVRLFESLPVEEMRA